MSNNINSKVAEFVICFSFYSPDALLLTSGDFNHAPPSSTLPTFTQYMLFYTRNNKILDLLYANTKEAWTSAGFLHMGGSDDTQVHILPV